MGSFWNALFAIVLIIIWIIAGGFITQSSVYLTGYRNDDDFLHAAYWYAFWASFITWFLIALFILLIILSAIGVVALFGTGVGEVGAAAAITTEGAIDAATVVAATTNSKTGKSITSSIKSGVSWVIILFLLFALVLVNITGILSALTARNISQSPNFVNTEDKLVTAYQDAIIAASISLGSGVLLIIGVITYFVVLETRKQKNKKALKEYESNKQKVLDQVNKLQVQSTRQKLLQQGFKES